MIESDQSQPSLIITDDGSPTLYDPKTGDHFHSLNGAVSESQHIFIANGLRRLYHKQHLSILEVGYGTGLNALLTFLDVQEGMSFDYTAVDFFPLNSTILAQIDYQSILKPSETPKIQEWLYAVPWSGEWVTYRPGLRMRKCLADWTVWRDDVRYDCVYYDAFAPNRQPEMWETSLFVKLTELANQELFLVTYTAKGDVRRALQSVGFDVKRLPGPQGKRHMSVGHWKRYG